MILRVIIVVLAVGINAIKWSNKLPIKPKEHVNKTGCYIREINDVIAFNDSVNALGFCYLIHCTRKQIDYISCGVNSRDHDNCIVIEASFDAPYPECCPQVKCYDSEIPWLNTTHTKKQNRT